MNERSIHTGEGSRSEALGRLSQACGLETPANSIADIVSQVIVNKFGRNVVAFSKHAGLHRNFVIDVRNGKYPTIREGHMVATEDSRYKSLAKAIGLNGEDISVFTDIVSQYQAPITTPKLRSLGSLGPEVTDVITIFRAEILRACPTIDPISLESAIDGLKDRLLGVLAKRS